MTGSGTCIDVIATFSLPGTGFGDVFHLVGVHTNESADLLLLGGAGVDHDVVATQRTLIDPQIGKLSVPAVFELEGQRHGRLLRV
jgi:hypothetical protein